MEFTETFKQTGPCAFSPNARFLAVAVDYRLVIRDVHTLKVPTFRIFHSIFRYLEEFGGGFDFFIDVIYCVIWNFEVLNSEILANQPYFSTKYTIQQYFLQNKPN